MPKPTPFLWFDTQAEEAAKFYTSIFPNSKIGTIARYGASGHESISFVMPCKTQEEIDQYWSRLGAGGSESQCGWLKDRYGLSWQIVPANLAELTKDPVRGGRVMQAILGMKKLNIAELERAAKAA